MPQNDNITRGEAARRLGLKPNTISIYGLKGRIRRVQPGLYSASSVARYSALVEFHMTTEGMGDDILRLVEQSWRQYGHSVSITRIAKLLRRSSSVVFHAVKSLEQEKRLLIVDHILYPIGLKEKIDAAIKGFYKPR